MTNFEQVFDDYRPLVLKVALRFLRTQEDAEDATQEVFTKVWRNLDAFNHDSSLKTWIYRIAVNTCIDHERKSWRKQNPQGAALAEISEDAAEPSLVSADETAELKLLAKERAAHLRSAILCLRPHLKDVFVLKEVEDMSYDEISRTLDLSIGTISSRLNRAKKALQESLSALVQGPSFAGAGA